MHKAMSLLLPAMMFAICIASVGCEDASSQLQHESIESTGKPIGPADIEKIELGMTHEEVVGVLGAPTVRNPSTDTYTYDIAGDGEVSLEWGGERGLVRVDALYTSAEGELVMISDSIYELTDGEEYTYASMKITGRPISPEGIEKIKPGMTLHEVVAILGHPTKADVWAATHMYRYEVVGGGEIMVQYFGEELGAIGGKYVNRDGDWVTIFKTSGEEIVSSNQEE